MPSPLVLVCQLRSALSLCYFDHFFRVSSLLPLFAFAVFLRGWFFTRTVSLFICFCLLCLCFSSRISSPATSTTASSTMNCLICCISMDKLPASSLSFSLLSFLVSSLALSSFFTQEHLSPSSLPSVLRREKMWQACDLCPLPGTRRKQPAAIWSLVLLSMPVFALVFTLLPTSFVFPAPPFSSPPILSFILIFFYPLCLILSLSFSLFLSLSLSLSLLLSHSHFRIHVVIRSDHFLRKHRARNIRAQAIEMTASISKFSETGSHLYLHLLLPPPPPPSFHPPPFSLSHSQARSVALLLLLLLPLLLLVLFLIRKSETVMKMMAMMRLTKMSLHLPVKYFYIVSTGGRKEGKDGWM